MMQRLTGSPIGRIVPTATGYPAYLPNPLPRSLSLSPALVVQQDRASRALATLVGVAETLPNPQIFIEPFLRREAVLSSRIEGTHTSLEELFQFEADLAERGDVLEVANYVSALNFGFTELARRPLSLSVIHAVHQVLLQGVRGEDKRPGERRDVQVIITGDLPGAEHARFIPPPPTQVDSLLDDWVAFLHEDVLLPPLVQCAMLHYQFETIHPYRDGNGRVGRLLILLFLCAKLVLSRPLLYLSAYFERNRQAYYDHLFRLSETGEWEPWLHFFLQGVIEESDDLLARSRQVRALHEGYREQLQMLRSPASALALVDELFVTPYMSVPKAQEKLGMTYAGAQRVMARLEEAGIVKPVAQTWPKLFAAAGLVHLLALPRVRAD